VWSSGRSYIQGSCEWYIMWLYDGILPWLLVRNPRGTDGTSHVSSGRGGLTSPVSPPHTILLAKIAWSVLDWEIWGRKFVELHVCVIHLMHSWTLRTRKNQRDTYTSTDGVDDRGGNGLAVCTMHYCRRNPVV